MSSFRTEVAHQLGREQATERLRAFVEKVREQFREHLTHIEGRWEDHLLRFALTTYGFNISGTLTVDDSVARVEGRLPLAALILKGKIEKAIASELKRELS